MRKQKTLLQIKRIYNLITKKEIQYCLQSLWLRTQKKTAVLREQKKNPIPTIEYNLIENRKAGEITVLDIRVHILVYIIQLNSFLSILYYFSFLFIVKAVLYLISYCR